MITIYGSPNCMFCLKAKQLAEMFELEHEYKYVSDHREEFMTNFPDAPGVPQIIWDGRKISGYANFAREVNDDINNGERL